MQDWQLLQEYIDNGSQAAFGTLVERYVNLVYTTCLREVGDAALAEDVTQVVFLLLAQKAPALRNRAALAGWFFNTARLAAKNALKQERRRRQREYKAVQMVQTPDTEQTDWRVVEPWLHEAVASLNASEREAVLLRFFERKNFKEIAAVFQISEDGARKRVCRALDKLRRYFLRHGVELSGAILGLLLGERAVQAAPAACVSKVLRLTDCVPSGGAMTQALGTRLLSVVETTNRAMLAAQAKAVVVGAISLSLVGLATNGVVRLAEAQTPGSLIPDSSVPLSALMKRHGAKPRRSRPMMRPRDHRTAAGSTASATLVATSAGAAGKMWPRMWLRLNWSMTPRFASLLPAVRALPTGSHFSLATHSLAAPQARAARPSALRSPAIRPGVLTATRFTPVALSPAALRADDTLASAPGLASAPRAAPEHDPVLEPLIGHSGDVRAIVYAPNGKLIATGGDDKTIKLWDARTGILLHSIPAHTQGVRTLAFSPDSTELASGSGERVVRIWNALTGGLLQSWPQQSGVTCVAFDPIKEDKGYSLAVASQDKTVRLWQVPAPGVGAVEPLWTWPVAGVETGVLTFSPDGKLLATGSADKTIRLWDVREGSLLRTLTGHKAGVTALSFSEDGQTIASGGDDGDGMVKLWDVEQGQEIRTMENPHTPGTRSDGRVWAVCLAPTGGTVAGFQAFGSVHLWNINTGQLKQELPNSNPIVCPPGPLAYSPDGITLAGASNSSISLWDAQSGKLRQRLPGQFPLTAALPAPDGRTLVCGGWSGQLQVWNLTTGALARVLPEGTGAANHMAFSPDGKILANAWTDEVHLYDSQSWRLTKTLIHPRKGGSGALSFSPDGRWLVTGGGISQSISLWDVATQQLFSVFETPGAQNGNFTFSPDGKLLATSYNNAISLWDMTTAGATTAGATAAGATVAGAGEPPVHYSFGDYTDLPEYAGFLCAMHFQPTLLPGVPAMPSRLMVVVPGNPADGIKLWNYETRQVQQTLAAPHGRLIDAVFSPDGQLVAGVGKAGLEIWDARSGQALATSPPGQFDDMFNLAFFADGKRLVTAGLDGMVRLWQLENNTTVTLQATLLCIPPPGIPLPGTQPAATAGLIAGDAFIIFTPEGYYMGSPGIERYIQWRKDNQVHAGAEFKAIYFRPDLVQRKLSNPQ